MGARADAPLFDATSKALRFALNHHLSVPRPAINRMMEGGKVRRIELADGTRLTVAAPRAQRGNAQLRGLDGAATAGMVLLVLSGLPEPQQLVLMAEMQVPRLPCSCRAPCCSGSRPNPEWSRAVTKICELLRDRAQLSKVPGKRGMSVLPELRRALVEKHFDPDRELPLEKLARAAGVSIATVANHRRPIEEYLEAQSRDGWEGFAQLMDANGLVGLIE